MKKIIKGICVFVFSIIMCVSVTKEPVYADVGYSDPLVDKVMVVNENGINATVHEYLNNYTINIPYGTILSIGYGFMDEIYVSYEGKEVSISIFDVKPVMDTFDPQEDMKIDGKPVLLYVVGEDVYLLKGPMDNFDKAYDNKLPKGTLVESEYHADNMNVNYYYVEYDGHSGWVNYNKLINYAPGKGLSKEENQLVKEHEVDILGYQTEIKGIKYYVKDENSEYWVSETGLTFNNVSNNKALFYSLGEEKIYSNKNCTNQIDTKIIDGEKNIKSFGYIQDTSDEFFYYFSIPVYEVEYEEGKYGYIKADNTIVGLLGAQKLQDANVKTIANCPVYSRPEENDELLIKTISSGNKIDCLYYVTGNANNDYQNWVGINTESGIGWISSYGTAVPYISSYHAFDRYTVNYSLSSESSESTEENMLLDQPSSLMMVEPKSSLFDKLLNSGSLYFAIGGVVVIGAVITIVVFNKNKKK